MLAAAASLAGCAERIVPLLVPVRTASVRPGRANEALVALPAGGVASVCMELFYTSGRLDVVRVGIINHYPERVTLFFTKTLIYIDDGDPLRITTYKDFNSGASNVDFHVLKPLPEGAAGKWLIPKRRFVTKSSIRGPTVVLSYSVDGHDGFVKVPYSPLWDITGQ